MLLSEGFAHPKSNTASTKVEIRMVGVALWTGANRKGVSLESDWFGRLENRPLQWIEITFDELAILKVVAHTAAIIKQLTCRIRTLR